MKRFQYSISGIFALTFLVAIVLSLRGGLGSQWSFETIWIAVFVLAYWKSPNKGWRQVVRATGTTGVVWGVLIVCVYAWFFNRRGAPGAIDLAIHGAILVLAAVLLAMAGACLVEGIRVAVRFLRRCTWPRRVVVAVALVASIPRVAVGWMGLRGSYWEPATVTSAAEAFDAAFPWLPSVQQKPELKYVRPGLPSPDGRFVAAILNGAQRVRVFDSARSKVVATLTAGRDEQFADLTFDRDGSVLAALVYSKSSLAGIYPVGRHASPSRSITSWVALGRASVLTFRSIDACCSCARVR
jgi:hypothetical protein